LVNAFARINAIAFDHGEPSGYDKSHRYNQPHRNNEPRGRNNDAFGYDDAHRHYNRPPRRDHDSYRHNHSHRYHNACRRNNDPHRYDDSHRRDDPDGCSRPYSPGQERFSERRRNGEHPSEWADPFHQPKRDADLARSSWWADGGNGAQRSAHCHSRTRRLRAARLRDAWRPCLLLTNFLCWWALPRGALSRLRMGRAHLFWFLPWSLVPPRILRLGLASLGRSNRLGHRRLGLGRAPWWGFYGGWWNPYPVYAAPYFWLTDYLLADSLQAAYAARAEANADAMAADAQASAGDNGGGGGDAAPAASAGVSLSPEVKEAIAQEVKAQLAAQEAQAATQGGAAAAGNAPAPSGASDQTPPPALDPANRTFVVDSDVTVVANGQECGLTSGDVVTRLSDTPDADQNVTASVSATKKGDCPSGATVAVKVDDLQEMYNHFQETLTNGMGELAKKQGTNGMPKAPDASTEASDIPAPAPDTTVAKTLQDQQQQADQTEAQVKQEAAAGGGGQ